MEQPETAPRYATKPGEPFPPGAQADDGGVNFSVFSRHASSVELLLYERTDSAEPFQYVRLDAQINKTFFFWHVYVAGLRRGVHYTWRVSGPGNTRVTGFRFDGRKELLDPWALAVTTQLWDRARASTRVGRAATSMRALVPDDHYDWEGDLRLNRPARDAVIYEMHVGGFTRHPSSGVAQPGTFRAVIEKIPYLKALGITDVELMPVMAFDEQDVPAGVSARGLGNFWGYSTHSFFSPHPGYCEDPSGRHHRSEFRDMVKALHRAGIGVILDVVLNHTAEGGEGGPLISFKGLGNEIFYHLDAADRRRYRDYTGCGNTINCNHPLVVRFIVDCLEYWVREMHVDGFRFDLASVLVRGEDGAPQYHAPAPWAIEFSRQLGRTRLIAEAWDAGGLYQVGDFPGYRWAEWNGRYRDVIRRFVRGDPGLVAEVATRVAGSGDMYQPDGRLPANSINFVTCHDGFTLHDLVSYGRKHNEGNGEQNRDGNNNNISWNCGAEGATDDAGINALRARQARNHMAILLLSIGVPMILSGDEVLRTQRGNNNAYCQDNEIGWFDWRLVERNADMLRFVRQMIALRKRHANLRPKHFLTGEPRRGAPWPDVLWHGRRLNEPLWDDPDARVLAYTLAPAGEGEGPLHVILNMADEALVSAMPAMTGFTWHRAVDTALSAPENALPPPAQPPIRMLTYPVHPRSVVVLEGRRPDE